MIQDLPNTSPRVVILADDLTGACDSAVPFARSGLHTEVLIEHSGRSAAEVWAINTDSRELAPAAAVNRLRREAARLPPTAKIIKKIDSVLRGNTFFEIRAALDLVPFDLAIMCPAYPALGRTVDGGTLHIRDLSGARSVPVLDRLAGMGLSCRTIPAGVSIETVREHLRASIESSRRLILADAVSQHDLETLVSAAQGLDRRILWIGSGGLTHALAGPPLPSTSIEEPRPGAVLFFVGSDHPVTLAQVAALRREADFIECIVESHSGTPLGVHPVMVFPIGRGSTSEAAIRQSVTATDPAEVSCLLLTGGDTAALVCRALDINALRLTREFAPGLPEAVAVGGRFEGVNVILKSGGFGDPDVFCRLAEVYARKEEEFL